MFGFGSLGLAFIGSCRGLLLKFHVLGRALDVPSKRFQAPYFGVTANYEYNCLLLISIVAAFHGLLRNLALSCCFKALPPCKAFSGFVGAV